MCAVRPVPSVLWCGLRTAVPSLSRKQKNSERHQETVGQVSKACLCFSLCPAFHPVIRRSLDLCVYRAGLDAASPAARLRSMTQNWANSKEEASDLQPVPDCPDQQTPGNTPAAIPPMLTPRLEAFVLGQVFIFCPFFSPCQKSEAAFCKMEHRAGV